MFSWEDTHDRVAIVQLNAELRHAQLELLSAQCATDRLRLRYSCEDVASFAERHLLQKAIRAASTLNEYYSSLDIHLRDAQHKPGMRRSHEDLQIAVERVGNYLGEQREVYFSMGEPISEQHRLSIEPFFSPTLLDGVRIVQLRGCRVPNPPFYDEAKAMGFTNFPEMTHMSSLTFLDVVVFNEPATLRMLFHGLVHAVQFQVLGLRRYVELFVGAFFKTQLHVTVPLEAQAFALESRFANDPEKVFSVDEQVRLWEREHRY